MGESDTMLFRKVGGRHQLSVDSPVSLHHLLDLDDAHWMATSAPIETFNCDPAFTKFLDADSDGRIRSDELRNAVKWLLDALRDISVLSNPDASITLAAINPETSLGAALLASAKLMLDNLNAGDSEQVTLAQARCRQDILSSGGCNGDGVIPADSLEDAKLAEFVKDIVDVGGGAPDASGGVGVTTEIVDKFVTDVQAYLIWQSAGESDSVLVWGAETAEAYDSLSALQGKIDQFFAQCELLAQDSAFEKCFTANDAEVAELDVASVEAISKRLDAAPLARPSSDGRLVFDENLNPGHKSAAAKFADMVLKRWKKGVSVKNVLTKEEWNSLKSEFAPFADWRAAKPAGDVDKLPLDKLKEYSKAGHDEKLAPIFEKDKAVADEIRKVEEVEKLILFKKHMLEFVNNFVSFASLYDPESLSILQVGRLVMDARHFEFNLNVTDIAKHKKIAAASNICVMYLKLTSKKSAQTRTLNVATGVTSGTVRNIRVGKRGVFLMPDGGEWDAEVVDFIQHPVSVMEALLSPFAKAAALVKKHTEKLKSTAYKKIEGGVDKSLTGAEQALAAKQPPKNSWTAPMLLLGGGIGVAGIGSAFASVMNALKGEGVLLKIGLFVLGAILVVATPIVIAAILKLRHRNIGMMLEACGWSINASMRMNRRLGLLFTRVPAYPRNSRRTIFDHTRHYLGKLDIERASWRARIILSMLVFLLAFAIGTAIKTIWISHSS